jgi:hypothetical protein
VLANPINARRYHVDQQSVHEQRSQIQLPK